LLHRYAPVGCLIEIHNVDLVFRQSLAAAIMQRVQIVFGVAKLRASDPNIRVMDLAAIICNLRFGSVMGTGHSTQTRTQRETDVRGDPVGVGAGRGRGWTR
jgi:hypothetical protein